MEMGRERESTLSLRSEETMTKRILVICDYLPHILEFMGPAIAEARRRGYEVIGAYFGAPARDMMAAMGINDLHIQGGAWDKSGDIPILQVPQAAPLLEKLKPTAVFIDIIGVGHAGGRWLEECHKRNITAIEFGGCRSRIHYFGKGAETATARYIAQLQKVGYGQHSEGLLAGTKAWQWVGLLTGDRLLQKFDKNRVRRQLGFRAYQKKYVVYVGNWGTGQGYAKLAAADLVEWDEMAQANELTLVYSPHPIFYYSEFPRHEIPPTTVLTANFPGAQLWGRQAKHSPVSNLIRGAEFLICPYISAVIAIAVAARIPHWLRRRSTGRADPAQFSRQAMQKGGRDPVQGLPGWPYIDRLRTLYDHEVRVESSYRTTAELEKLFEGELPFPGTAEDHARWDEEWKLRLDGKTARRIIDLVER